MSMQYCNNSGNIDFLELCVSTTTWIDNKSIIFKITLVYSNLNELSRCIKAVSLLSRMVGGSGINSFYLSSGCMYVGWIDDSI